MNKCITIINSLRNKNQNDQKKILKKKKIQKSINNFFSNTLTYENNFTDCCNDCQEP